MKQPYEIMRELRVDNDLKQKQVAAAIEISQQKYSLYESGKTAAPMRVLIALADHYNISLDYIVGRTKSTASVEALNKPIHASYTAGELLSDVLSLNEEGKAAVVEFINFQKAKQVSEKDQ